jgi:leucyl aminopeptidase
VTTTLQISQSAPRDVQADAIIIGVIQGPDGPLPAPGAEDVDAALGGSLAETLAALGATGRQDEVTRIASAGRLRALLIAAVGTGTANVSPATSSAAGSSAAGSSTTGSSTTGSSTVSSSTVSSANGSTANGSTTSGPATSAPPAFDGEALRRAAGAAVRSLCTPRIREIAISMPARDAAETEAVALGALLGSYTFGKYRDGGQQSGPGLTLLAHGDQAAPAAARAQILATAMSLVRDLVNTSPSQLYPETFAAEASRIAAEGGLDIDVLDEKALADGGYGGITGVGQGSVHPPRLVRLAYTHPAARQTVVFAGKGITFDSGGLSLKPSKSMETMKSDMGGAAAVLAALQAVAALRPEVNVIGYLPLAENMPGGGAQRPSDVVTIYGGKTVEVLNTDAEGRLVLADALARSAADSPDLLVDVATLTGAQLVALGPRISGVMANDDDVRDGVVDAARRAGEAAWPMPLPQELRKGLDSSVADLANVTGERDGGMLVAGLFLAEFVPAGVRWAHLDIAGPAFHEGEPYGYTPKGGTGAAVRTLVQVALDVADGRM